MLGNRSGSLRKLNIALVGLVFATAGCAAQETPAEQIDEEAVLAELVAQPAAADEPEEVPAVVPTEESEPSAALPETGSTKPDPAVREPLASKPEPAAAPAVEEPAAGPAEKPVATATEVPTTLAKSQPAPAATAKPAAQSELSASAREQGRLLFTDWSCGACHTLADAGASGQIGPSLDRNANLTQSLVIDRITRGQGAMPGFGGQMTDEEIASLSKYIMQVKK